MSDILLVAPHFPPYGGIAVYGKRLEEGLKSFGLSVEAVDVVARTKDGMPLLHRRDKLIWAFYTIRKIMTSKSPIAHILLTSVGWGFYATLTRVFFAWLVKKRIVLTITGDMSGLITPKSFIRSQLIATAFTSWIDVVISCNRDVHQSVVNLMGSRVKCELITNALPMPTQNWLVLPEVIERFIAVHRKLILCIAGPERVYGLHILLQALAIAKIKISNVATCILTRLPLSGAYAAYINGLTRSLGLEKIVLFIERIDDVASLISRCDVFVRTTSEDGDSLSVREALLLRRPVIASDAAPRPKGCLLFRVDDAADLAKKIVSVLEENGYAHPNLNELQNEAQQNLQRIISLYKSIGLNFEPDLSNAKS